MRTRLWGDKADESWAFDITYIVTVMLIYTCISMLSSTRVSVLSPTCVFHL